MVYVRRDKSRPKTKNLGLEIWHKYVSHTVYNAWAALTAGYGLYRTIAIPLRWSCMRIKRGTAKAHLSCPIYIERTSIRARLANKRQLKLTTLDVCPFLHYLLFTETR